MREGLRRFLNANYDGLPTLEFRVDIDLYLDRKLDKMITDDSTTPLCAMKTLFVSMSRSDRIITILREALLGALATSNFEVTKMW